jgi:hypothetical protein
MNSGVSAVPADAYANLYLLQRASMKNVHNEFMASSMDYEIMDHSPH